MKSKSFVFSFVLLFALAAFSFQFLKTSLRITVRNELGNHERDVKVTLYENKEDYEQGENEVAFKHTDLKGNVTFDGLKPIVYYVSAEKGDRSNYGVGEKTDTLTANRLNRVTIIIMD